MANLSHKCRLICLRIGGAMLEMPKTKLLKYIFLMKFGLSTRRIALEVCEFMIWLDKKKKEKKSHQWAC